MSWSSTTIATTRYNILLVQDLWTNEPLPPPEYPPPLSCRLSFKTPVQGIHSSFRKEQLNVITIQDKEGLVEPEPKPRQGIVVSKSKGSKNIHEPCSNNNKGPIYEERRLQIYELDEWQTHKPRTHGKPKPRHDKLNFSSDQLKVGDKVLLDVADPRITSSEPNKEIPLTVLSIFPYSTVEVIHPKFGTFKAHGRALGRAHTTGGDRAVQYGRVETGQNLSRTQDAVYHVNLTWQKTAIPASNKRKRATSSSGVGRCIDWAALEQLSVPEFEIALGLYVKEFMDDNELDTLHHHIYYSPSKYWKDLVLASATYDPSAPRHQLSLHP
ncbi:hypothetical protein GOBAR_AA20840 [Gossypium barbadense]|uniref:Uncharacterized protein n=1 Tax=Gossypium barbadense TaxID=3634 RepID=A0A2P5X917_GOSBA|nr:hypothetical protein GOBAR_AA20840 [Gossypium barbadense]